MGALSAISIEIEKSSESLASISLIVYESVSNDINSFNAFILISIFASELLRPRFWITTSSSTVSPGIISSWDNSYECMIISDPETNANILFECT